MSPVYDYGKSIGAQVCGLTSKDLLELNQGTIRVLMFMSDGLWHSSKSIEMAAGENGIPAGQGLRRMRELRQWGIKVPGRRMGKSRSWEYRLVWGEPKDEPVVEPAPPPPPPEFFNEFLF